MTDYTLPDWLFYIYDSKDTEHARKLGVAKSIKIKIESAEENGKLTVSRISAECPYLDILVNNDSKYMLPDQMDIVMMNSEGQITGTLFNAFIDSGTFKMYDKNDEEIKDLEVSIGLDEGTEFMTEFISWPEGSLPPYVVKWKNIKMLALDYIEGNVEW